MPVKLKLGSNATTAPSHGISARAFCARSAHRRPRLSCSSAQSSSATTTIKYQQRRRRPPRRRPHLRQRLRRSTPRRRRSAPARAHRRHHRAELRQAGYNANPQLGTFQLNGDTILIKPGPQSYHSTDGATITTADGEVVSPSPPRTAPRSRGYKLEPQLITALSEDKNRTKRRLVTYDEIPPHMVQAVTRHRGPPLLRARRHQLSPHSPSAPSSTSSTGHKSCGGSTLTQQLAKRLLPLARQEPSRASSPRS